MVHLQKLYEQFQKKGLVILGFNASDDKQTALEMLKKNLVSFPNIIDSSDIANNIQFKEYGASGVPLNYIIDREGKIVDAWYGYEEGHKKALEVLEKLGIK